MMNARLSDPQQTLIVASVEGTVIVQRNGETRALSVGDTLRRGEIIRTASDSRAALTCQCSLCDIATFPSCQQNAFLALDERSEIELEWLRPERMDVRLTSGRLFARHPGGIDNLVVTTNRTSSTIFDGAVSVVNFDFLETVSVMPFETAAAILVKQNEGTITNQPVNIHETDPVGITDAAFDPLAPSVAAFYQWAWKETEFSFSQ